MLVFQQAGIPDPFNITFEEYVESTGVTLVWGSLYGSMVSLGLVAVENVAQ